MAIASTISRMPPYVGNGTASEFAYTFRIFDEDDLVVIAVDVDGNETTLTKDTHYTLDGVGEDGGGAAYLVNGAFAWQDDDGNLDTDWELLLLRVPSMLQAAQYRNAGRYFGADAERDLDKACIRDLYLLDQVQRGLILPNSVVGFDTTLPIPDPDRPYFRVKSDGTGLESAPGTNVTDIDPKSIGPAELADTAVVPGIYILPTITIDQQGRITAAASGAGFTTEDAEDAVGGILTNSATISWVYNDGANTITAIVIAGSIGTTQLAPNGVTNAKLAQMPARTVKANLTAAAADPQDATAAQFARMLCLCVPFGGTAALSSTHPSSCEAPYVSRTGFMYSMMQGNVAYKINSRKGLPTALAPSTLAGGAAGGCIYLGDALHKVLFYGNGGFITMDVDTDVFDTLVNPTGFGQVSAAYHAASGYLYWANSVWSVSRCLLDGTSRTVGGIAAGTLLSYRVCIIGDMVFSYIRDQLGGATKIYKYDIASWPTLGAAVTLAGDMGGIGGLCANGDGNLLVGDYNGTLLVVNPTTLATVATITLSGVAARKTEHTIYDATTDRIFAIDNTGKIWVIDGTSYAVLGYCVPAVTLNEATTAGLTYDGDLGILSARTYSGTLIDRWRA